MLRSVCVFLLTVHLAASSLFFHVNSSIDLSPNESRNGSLFGFSLAYQKGEHPNLVIGAPLYDQTGRVFQRSIDGLLTGSTSCEPVHIDLDELNVNYSRSLSPNQNFYLGASIAATENFFLTCAPLRTAFFYHEGNESDFGAYGLCFNSNRAKQARVCRGSGREELMDKNKKFKHSIYGGSGWSTLVDEINDRIIVAKSFAYYDATVSKISKPDENYESLILSNKIKKEPGIMNYGQAMTIGNFFDTNKTNIHYAISMRTTNAKGVIQFLDSQLGRKDEWRLEDSVVGSMFGAALCSADVIGDARAELLVGAPAHVTDARSYDRGAVHIYESRDQGMVMKLTILGKSDGARFGTTLAANDVDGDSFTEILIGAPYENKGEGVLYVLCGYEIHKIMQQGMVTVSASDLKRTQRIRKENYRTLGFSLQPISDFNENGSDELGVGSPGNSTVTVYKGIRSVTAEVTSRFPGRPLESETEYVFSSCVTVVLPPKPTNITTKLLVTNVLNGYDASFTVASDATYQIDLMTGGIKTDDGKTEYCKNLTIVSSSYCTVITGVSLVDNIQEHKVFSDTWVTLSAQSELEKTVQLVCRCNETNCAPELSAQIEWIGGDELYVVGTSRLENVSISIHNNGTMGCNGCATVRVSGAIVDKLRCDYKDARGEYECRLNSPFRENSTQKIDLILLMNRITNQDKNLEIIVTVRENCDVSEGVTDSLKVPYVFNTDLVVVNGSCLNRNISDTELLDKSEDIITDEQIYTIFNNQSVTWKNLLVKITAAKKPFIQSLSVSVKQTKKCVVSNDTESFYSSCPLTLTPYSIVKLTVTTTIFKDQITNYLQDRQISITSELELELFSDEIKQKTLTTVMTFEKEQTVGQNKTLIIIIAVILGLIMLLIITLILYKLNFFKRKNKEELQVLKKEIRKRSIRKHSEKSRSPSQFDPNQADDLDCIMEDVVMVDESPFDDPIPIEELNAAKSASTSAPIDNNTNIIHA